MDIKKVSSCANCPYCVLIAKFGTIADSTELSLRNFYGSETFEMLKDLLRKMWLNATAMITKMEITNHTEPLK